LDGQLTRVIANGIVAAPYGMFRAHVVITGERIAAFSDDDGVLAGADEIIDANGLVILPGSVDLHGHFEDPGHTEREDFHTGTMAAAAGGVTGVFEHPLTYPPTTTVELYRDKREMACAKVVVDFGLWGALTPISLDQMEGQWHEGAPGFKAFMTDSEPAYPRADDGALLEGMRTAARLGALVLVHAENNSLLNANETRLEREGRRDPMAHHESRPPIVEEEAVHRALFLAGHTGARCQIVHSSCPGSVDLVKQARSQGQQATIEVCSHHLLLDLDDLRRLGPFGRCAPALRDRALVEKMWDHVLDGSIDCLVSDHCAYTIEEKSRGYDDIFAAPNGCQVMQEMVPVVLDEAFHRRGMALDAFARLISERPARIAGVYPRKGSLLVGSDADLVLWDLNDPWVINSGSQQFSKNPWSPFEGRKIQARVVRTLLRGQTVYADGEIRVGAGFGRFLSGRDDYSLAGLTPSEPGTGS
jgi:allantoinase